MARTTTRIGLGAFGLLAGLGTSLSAQTLWLPASDPVGIARGGAGVAFGQSLEAAALNPALLVTLREPSSAFVAVGMELQSSQVSLAAVDTKTLFSSDRNRLLPSLGAAWKLRPDFYLGVKIDNPFMRHGQFTSEYTGRFQGQSFGLSARRMEMQAAWAINPNWSVGATFGVTRVRYNFSNSVRVPVPSNPLLPENPDTNPSQGLLEATTSQEGTKVLPSYSLGFRWAINPRWTVGGAWQGAIKGTLGLTATLDTSGNVLVGNTGFGAPLVNAEVKLPALKTTLSVAPGDGEINLPSKLSVGIRNRLSQVFTWEVDARYIQGSSLRLPGFATVTGPSGTVSGRGLTDSLHSGFGLSLAGEIALGKRLVGRLGIASDPGLHDDPSVEPMLGGARSASFSAGFGWKVFGGELNLGWQVRQSQDVEVKKLDVVWSLREYKYTQTRTQVEGMGHLWSLGFKKAF